MDNCNDIHNYISVYNFPFSFFLGTKSRYISQYIEFPKSPDFFKKMYINEFNTLLVDQTYYLSYKRGKSPKYFAIFLALVHDHDGLTPLLSTMLYVIHVVLFTNDCPGRPDPTSSPTVPISQLPPPYLSFLSLSLSTLSC